MENQQQDAQRRALQAQSNEPASTDAQPSEATNRPSEATNGQNNSSSKRTSLAAESPQTEPTASDSRDTQPHSSTASEQTQTTQRHDTAVSKKSSWSIRLAVLLSLSMGGAALAGGYYLYQQLLVQFHHSKALEENATMALHEPVSRIGKLEERQQQMVQLEEKLVQLTSEQTAIEQGLARLAQKTPDDWVIAEADYLVRMAGRKLWLEQDPSTALSLLKTADERIESLQSTALLPLRKALAADMVQLTSMHNIDIASNVYALDEIMQQLDALRPGRNQTSYQPARNENLSSSINDWQSNLAKSWKALVSDFITVRHRASDITPLLSPEQEWYLKENIRAKLLQAQLALYRHDESSFKNAITMANGWVKQYFSLDEGSGKNISTNLDKLLTLQIDAVSGTKFQVSDLLRALVQKGGFISTPKILDQASTIHGAEKEPAAENNQTEALTSPSTTSPEQPTESEEPESSSESPVQQPATEPTTEAAAEKQENSV